MGYQTFDEVIDGHNVTVAQLPARRSLKLKIKLVKLLGPSIASFMGEYDSKKEILDQKIDSGVMIKAFEELADRLDENDFERLVDQILEQTRVDNKEVKTVFDELFAGDLGLMYKILWFTLKCNYQSFFGQSGIGSLLAKNQAQ